MLGAASCGYLAVAARSMPATQFARLGLVWSILFTVGPGLFLPLEQELGRRLAALHSKRVLWPALRRTALAAGLLAGVVAIAGVGLRPVLVGRLLDGDNVLFLALLAGGLALAPAHLVRGTLAGLGQFARYGCSLAADGVLRVVGAALLAVLATKSAAPFAWLLAAAPLAAALISVTGVRWTPADAEEQRRHAVTWPALVHGMGWLLVGSFAAQVLINGSVVAVKLLAAPGDALAGRFVTALALARAPLFLFAALQASLLPGFVRMLAANDVAGVRRTLRRLVGVLAGLGAAASLTLLLVGAPILRLLFGAGPQLSRWPLVVLSCGCTIFMLAAAIGQLLIALHRARAVAVAWLVGAVAFCLCLMVPGEVTMRASLALLIGSMASLVLVRVPLRRAVSGRWPA